MCSQLVPHPFPPAAPLLSTRAGINFQLAPRAQIFRRDVRPFRGARGPAQPSAHALLHYSLPLCCCCCWWCCRPARCRTSRLSSTSCATTSTRPTPTQTCGNGRRKRVESNHQTRPLPPRPCWICRVARGMPSAAAGTSLGRPTGATTPRALRVRAAAAIRFCALPISRAIQPDCPPACSLYVGYTGGVDRQRAYGGRRRRPAALLVVAVCRDAPRGPPGDVRLRTRARRSRVAVDRGSHACAYVPRTL